MIWREESNRSHHELSHKCQVVYSRTSYFRPKSGKFWKYFLGTCPAHTCNIGMRLADFCSALGRGHAQEFWDGEVSVLGALFAQPLLVWWSQGQRWRQTLGERVWVCVRASFSEHCTSRVPGIHPKRDLKIQVCGIFLKYFSTNPTWHPSANILSQWPRKAKCIFPFPSSTPCSARLTLS